VGKWVLSLVIVIDNKGGIKCLTELVFFAMGSYGKKWWSSREPPLLKWVLDYIWIQQTTNNIIIYVNKCICVSKAIP
jgi:hypothetical protein